MSSKLRVGLIGCGLIGHKRAAVIQHAADAELVIVADVDIKRTQVLATIHGCIATTDWQTVIHHADIDAVLVATTNEWLAPITIAALSQGKHVLCEKPPGRTLGEAIQMLEASQRHNVRLKIGFNHRHYPHIKQMYTLFRNGMIGEPMIMRCIYGHGGRKGYEQEWRTNYTISGGGELLDQGIHVVDLFNWFLGSCQEVVAWNETFVWKKPEKQVSVEDNALAMLRYPDSVLASMHVSWTRWRNSFTLELLGQRGYLLAEGLGGSYGIPRLILGIRHQHAGPPEEQIWNFPSDDTTWEQEWRIFNHAIRDGKPLDADGYDGVAALRIIEALYNSHHWGVSIKL